MIAQWSVDILKSYGRVNYTNKAGYGHFVELLKLDTGNRKDKMAGTHRPISFK